MDQGRWALLSVVGMFGPSVETGGDTAQFRLAIDLAEGGIEVVHLVWTDDHGPQKLYDIILFSCKKPDTAAASLRPGIGKDQHGGDSAAKPRPFLVGC